MTARDAVPAPAARPDIPILIAARRPRMLELTARHADAWNLAWFGMPDERWAGVRDELAAACVAVERDPATLERTVGVIVRYPDLVEAGASADAADAADAADGSEPPEAAVGVERALVGDAAVAAGLAAYAGEGTGHMIAVVEPTTPEAVARFAEAVRNFRAQAGSGAEPGTV